MSSVKEHFVIPARYKTWTLALMGVGVLSLIVGFILYGNSDQGARFWASLLQNSVYFLLITNAAMFFFCATSLAWAGFQMSFRRVTEAVSASVIPIGVITFVILMCIVFGRKDAIYEWVNPGHVAGDTALHAKSGFLNPTFFTVWSILSIGLWTLLGIKMRKMSRSTDDKPLTVAEGKKFIFTNTV